MAGTTGVAISRKTVSSGSARKASISAADFRKLLKSLPVEAQKRYKHFKEERERREYAHQARFDRIVVAQKTLAQRYAEKASLTRFNAAREVPAELLKDADEAIAEAKDEISRINQEGKHADGSIDIELIDNTLAQHRHRKFVLLSPRDEIPEQSAKDDIKLLAKLRGDMDAARERIRQIDLAQLPEEVALAKVMDSINRIATAATPDFAPTLRMQKQISENRRQGDVKWPQKYLGNDRWEPDSFGMLIWLMRPELEKRAAKEISRLAKADNAIPLADRPAAKAELDIEIRTLQYKEEFIVSRLHDAGRTDVKRRGPFNAFALLQIGPR
jgi:hypothetical protein